MSKRGPITNLGERARDNLWKPGKSMNPGGRPKAQIEARKLAMQLISEKTDGGQKIVEFVIDVLNNMNGPGDDGAWDSKSRRWAADFLADRLWGKAPLIIDVGLAQGTVEMTDMRGKSIDELRRLAAGEDGDPPGDVH